MFQLRNPRLIRLSYQRNLNGPRGPFTTERLGGRSSKDERFPGYHRSRDRAAATVCAVAIILPDRRALDHSDLRFRILRILEAEPDLSQRQLADRLGISLGRLNYCLHALVEKGLLKFSNFRASDDKRRYLYLLTPSGISEKVALTGQFLTRKMQEHAELTAEIEALKAELDMARSVVSGD